MEESNEYLRAIRRNWHIPVLAFVLGILAMFFTTPAKPKTTPVAYRAVHTILLKQTGESSSITTNQLTLFTTVGDVPERVKKLLNWTGTAAALAAQVVAQVDPAQGTFTVSSQQNEPKRAEVLANAMGVFQFELHLAAVLFNEVIQQQGGQVFEIFVGCVNA